MNAARKNVRVYALKKVKHSVYPTYISRYFQKLCQNNVSAWGSLAKKQHVLLKLQHNAYTHGAHEKHKQPLTKTNEQHEKTLRNTLIASHFLQLGAPPCTRNRIERFLQATPNCGQPMISATLRTAGESGTRQAGWVPKIRSNFFPCAVIVRVTGIHWSDMCHQPVAGVMMSYGSSHCTTV